MSLRSCSIPREGSDAGPDSTDRYRPVSSSPGAAPHPLRTHSPSDPVPRANPYPEVTDRFCRLPLPTFSCRLEAVHLGDLLRMWVRSGTRFINSYSDFQGPTETQRTPQEARCFTESKSLSQGEPIPGTRLLTKKRKLSPRSPSASPS